MIKKYIYGNPFETDAVVANIPTDAGVPAYGSITTEEGFRYTYTLAPKDRVYGLGENVRGINKRGFEYISNCTD